MKAGGKPAPAIPDLWRGWRDPATGMAAPRLGTDSVEQVFTMREALPYVPNRAHAWLSAAPAPEYNRDVVSSR